MSALYQKEDWEHGLRCAACNEHFIEGQPIAERLDAFTGDIPIVIIICFRCDLEGRPIDDGVDQTRVRR